MPQRTKDVNSVPSACCLLGRMWATSAPTPAATIVAAIGKSWSALIRSSEVI